MTLELPENYLAKAEIKEEPASSPAGSSDQT
jgi:hypothetical protein